MTKRKPGAIDWKSLSLIERFEMHHSPEPTSGCWLWHGAWNGVRGTVRYKNKNLLAAHVSWEIHRGPIPGDLWVLHKCDTPLCVNPDHLFLGDASANMRDMWVKGRHVPGMGMLTHGKYIGRKRRLDRDRYAANYCGA